ncbi:MAG: molecular chaperone DnaK [Saprospiraceae bacterium]|nr:MAG: molecular chaperone DnaK [Saprospiraceae bacterium]
MSEQTEKTRYTDEELEEFRELIQEKLEKAKSELEFYQGQLTDMADNPDAKVRGLDDGIGTVESERLISMAGRQKKHIQHLENALFRIQNKVYGICRATGKLISKERLRAVPHATLSIEAKQSRKK